MSIITLNILLDVWWIGHGEKSKYIIGCTEHFCLNCDSGRRSSLSYTHCTYPLREKSRSQSNDQDQHGIFVQGIIAVGLIYQTGTQGALLLALCIPCACG